MIRFLLTALTAFTFYQTYAQADSTVKELGEVIVSANRIAQKETEIPYTVKSVSKTDLNRFSPRTAPEALMGLNGVFVQKTNHGGGSAFVRGLTGNQTLILVDGIRLNNSTFRYGPNQYLNTIDAYTIYRMEVARGTGSVQYGTDAMGGVIHVITKDPQWKNEENKNSKSLSGAAIAKWMSGNMEQTARAELQYSAGKLAVAGGITVRKFGDVIGGDTTGKQFHSGYNELAYDVKMKWKLKENIQFTAAQQFLQQKNVPVYHKILLENFLLNEMDPQQRMLNYARLLVRNNNKFFQVLELTASFQQSVEGRNSRKNGSIVERREKDKVNTAGVTFDITSAAASFWKINSGAEFYNDRVYSTRTDVNLSTNVSAALRGLYPNNSRYGNYSLFTLHHFFFRNINIDAGLRYNRFNIRISDTSLGNVKINPSAVVGNAAFLYKLSGNHSLFTNYSGGFRAPNVDDMGTLGIVDFRYEIPASDLLPEKSHNFEAGYKYRGKKLQVTVSAYYMQLQQIITRVKIEGEQINGYNVYKKENTEEAYIKGAEVDVNYNIAKGLNISAASSYTYGQNTAKREPMRRIPPFNGRIAATYKRSAFFAAGEVMFASEQTRLAQGDKDDNRIPAGGTPGFCIINVYAGYEWKQIQFNTGLQNITNQDYRTHGSGINGYGRSLWINVQFGF
ncbi:MAG: TonB-dependent receptor [Lacibacter sp.]